ncbi:MAG: PD-(D/E)XK nuclease family protein [Candidatus Dadabacteria bacterium]|nr:PD-(D/E)XK nuclease family protein [Candidatus Dadabacteria bacterium]
MEQLRISGKNLGELALPDFCPRCFWIKQRCKRLPFQIFPGIFSSIDSYSKKITNFHFVRNSEIPSWFAEFGDLGEPVKVPHHTKFKVLDEETGVLLTGAPDEVFYRPDRSYFIADYKTARFTGHQDSLMPIYVVQLNAYAYIAERCGMGPVSGLGLVYYEPNTDVTLSTIDSVVMDHGFSMSFSGKLLPIDLDTAMVPPLLRRVREIAGMSEAPEGAHGCRDCEAIGELIRVVEG